MLNKILSESESEFQDSKDILYAALTIKFVLWESKNDEIFRVLTGTFYIHYNHIYKLETNMA